MNRRTIFIAATLVSVLLYLLFYRQLFALCVTYLLTPRLLHGAMRIGGETALRLLHAVATLMLNVLLLLPVAIAIALVFRRRRLILAAAVGVWLLAPDILAIPRVWQAVADHQQYLATQAMAVVSVFTALVGSTYVTSRITSNLRWSGP